jgi:hypothetical protein
VCVWVCVGVGVCMCVCGCVCACVCKIPWVMNCFLALFFTDVLQFAYTIKLFATVINTVM